jgi:hypothetical protein
MVDQTFRLSPPNRLARTDQPGKIERFGRYGDRVFHAPLSDAISMVDRHPAVIDRGRQLSSPGSLFSAFLENPLRQSGRRILLTAA